MKKMIIMAAVAALAAAQVLADRDVATLRAEAKVSFTNGTYKAYCAAITTNEWRAVFEDVLADAATNHYAGTPGKFWLCPALVESPLISEYDQRLADSGIGSSAPWGYQKYPKVTDVWISSPTNAAKVATIRATIALMHKYGRVAWHLDFSEPELANFVSEMHACAPQDMKKGVRGVLNRVQSVLKRKMRDKGIPIIVKDGVNPVQAEIDKLTEAFNAPKFAGVKEWFAKWYPEYTWIDSEVMTAEEVNTLKDKVFYGEVPFNVKNQNILQFYLGVTEYNKFVQAFNN